MTDNDVIIDTKLKDRKKKVAKLERERKSMIEFTERHEAALVVLNHLKHELCSEVDKLCDNDMKTLFRWKGVPASKKGLALNKWEIYKIMVKDGKEGNNDSNNPALWTDEDENALKEASREDIDIGDTALGRLEAQRKKEFRLISKKFMQTEWAKMNDGREADSATPNEEDLMEGSV